MKTHLYYLSGIIGLAVLVYILWSQLESSKSALRQANSVIAEKNAEIQYRTNREGRIIAEKQAAEIRAKELEKMYPQVYDEIKKDFDLKIKNLRAYIKNEFEARGSGTGEVTHNHYYDSAENRVVRFRDFKMDDGYLKFKTRLYDSLSNALYEYVYSDTASTVIDARKKWLFGKEQLYASTMFKNPNAKITGTTNILVNNYRDKRLSFGISAGWGVLKVGNEVRTGWFMGPSIEYALFKF